MTNIVQQFKERRRALGITQTQLAEAADVSKSTVEKMDAGIHTNLTLDTVNKIDRALTELESEASAAVSTMEAPSA